ncbi:MAG: SMC family ATPase [Ktedonobacteraceae bacterium]
MLITRVELENIKSYKKVLVNLRPGTTAISGSNGAGKTTLVEAIGYALFNHLPYKQDQFVREGEKYGRIVIHLIGSDDRPYIVERRCGSGARWFMTDEESTERLEQGADMQDRLHDLFGIDRERPLDSLFKDALGVPQGTFTAIFLETASKRKQTFDALLQIEDYKTSAEYLLQVKHYYDEQIATQRIKINELTIRTSELGGWRALLDTVRQRDEQQKQQYIEWSQQLSQNEGRLIVLSEQQHQLEQLKQHFTTSQAVHTNAQQVLGINERSLQEARTAQAIILASLDDFQRYQQAEQTLAGLRKNEQQRNKLRDQQAKLHMTKVKVEATQRSLRERLEEVALARQRVADLATSVAQQSQLETQRDDLKDKVTRYTTVMKEGTRLRSTIDQYRQQQAEIQQRILTIEPLQPIADRFHEWNDQLNQLQIQSSERRSRQQSLQKSREEHANKQRDRDTATEKLRKIEAAIEKREAHRQEAEEMPVLLSQRSELTARQNRLEGNIEGYVKSRAQSAGGQCPLLHETCLNIKGRGLVSLESYFDGLLTTEHAELESVLQRQQAVTQREQQIKKYVEGLDELGLYIERRDIYGEQLKSIALQITKLERDIESLTEELDMLSGLDQRMSEAKKGYDESKDAGKQVRDLPGLYKQVQQYQEQIQAGDATLIELRQELTELKGSEGLLKQTNDELAILNDPRSRSKAQQNVVEQEGNFSRQLQVEEQRLQETQLQMQLLDTQLAQYADLDRLLQQQEALRLSSLNGYQNYLKNEDVARLLPEREQAYQHQLQIASQAVERLQAASQAFHDADIAFNVSELLQAKDEVEHLKNSLATLKGEIERNQHDMHKLEKQIAQAEVLLQELEAAQKEQQTLEDLNTMMAQFRGYIKEAAPHVLKAMLADISAEANRIFGEIMGDRTAQLSWQNDYEIILRRQSTNRTFAQLSGGEQMSAALAIRLALLKKLSTLNLAFFDEPTQNMDELRRMNLAEQIRRVRGFDQLLVISHDDTFEQGLDSIVRLAKEHGETHIVTDEEAERERVLNYAS